MTVGENLRMAGLLYGMGRRAVSQRSQQLLEAVACGSGATSGRRSCLEA